MQPFVQRLTSLVAAAALFVAVYSDDLTFLAVSTVVMLMWRASLYKRTL